MLSHAPRQPCCDNLGVHPKCCSNAADWEVIRLMPARRPSTKRRPATGHVGSTNAFRQRWLNQTCGRALCCARARARDRPQQSRLRACMWARMCAYRQAWCMSGRARACITRPPSFCPFVLSFVRVPVHARATCTCITLAHRNCSGRGGQEKEKGKGTWWTSSWPLLDSTGGPARPRHNHT